MKFFITLTFIAFVVGNTARIQFGSVGVSPLDISVLGLFLYWLSTKNFIVTVNKDIYLKRPLWIFALICVLSLVLSGSQFKFSDVFIGSLYLLRYLLYSSLFFIFLSLSPPIKAYTKKMMFGAGTIFVLIGFLQYFFFQDLRQLYFFGWDDHLYRLVGSFLDPNFSGVFLALFVLFLSNNLLSRKFTWTKQTYRILFLLISSIIALLLTYSRTSYIACLIGVIVLLLLYQKGKFIFWLVLVAVGLILLFANSHFENTNLFRSVSSLGRVETAQNAFSIFQKNPILGVGFNMYRFAQHKYGFRETPLWSTSHADAGADTSILFVLATVGITGLISYLYLWKKLFMHAFEKKNRTRFAKLFIASGITILVSSIFVNSLFYTYLMVWMWILAGLMDEKSL